MYSVVKMMVEAEQELAGVLQKAVPNDSEMKILFSHSQPFFLAHGGAQTLLEALMRELAGLGVDVEPERWWDENQTGDIIHYMNRPRL